MSEKWYRVRRWSATPRAVNVVKETDKTVTIDDGNGRFVVHKVSEGERVFKIWSDARRYCIDREVRNYERAQADLVCAARELEKANALPVNEPN